MKKSIFMVDELIARTDASKADLKEWEKLGLVVPSGYTEDRAPCYGDAAVETVRHIMKLKELGYGLDEIQRIVRKVGLPGTRDEKTEIPSKESYLTVGHLAEQVGVSPRTIKHWEDKGIIDPDMRSEGGFRLYSEGYVYLCRLIMNLQRFGYTLEEIKIISDYFRDFLAIQQDPMVYAESERIARLDTMLEEIGIFFEKIELLKEGIKRWEDLLKKKKKEIQHIKNQTIKQSDAGKAKKNA